MIRLPLLGGPEVTLLECKSPNDEDSSERSMRLMFFQP